GREIVYSSGPGSSHLLWRVAATGSSKSEQLAFAAADAAYPVFSASRGRLVYSWGYGDSDIWRVELAVPTRAASRSGLISSYRGDSNSEYSPDGKRIAFTSDRLGSNEIWTCHSDGSSCVQVSSLGGPEFSDARWSADGKYIAFTLASAGQSNLYVVNAEG